jgi:hypothetical protein
MKGNSSLSYPKGVVMTILQMYAYFHAFRAGSTSAQIRQEIAQELLADEAVRSIISDWENGKRRKFGRKCGHSFESYISEIGHGMSDEEITKLFAQIREWAAN